MALLAMELKLVVFWFFADHTRRNKHIQNASTIFVRHFMHVYPHTQTTVHTHLMSHGYFDGRRSLNTPVGAPCRDRDGTDSGISALYLW